MDLIAVTFIIVAVWRVRPTRDNLEYMGRENTTSIKGIFAIIILFGHARQYLNSPDYDTLAPIYSYRFIYDSILDFIGQLMVVMFLVYSGFGIMESYKKNGDMYLDGFLKKRFLKTLVHFDLAVALFMILAIFLHRDYSMSQYILCWTGWSSIGNSNWFIFDILILYLTTYAGLLLCSRKGWGKNRFLIFSYVSTFAMTMFLYKVKSEELWWCDTILAYPTGMLWSVYRNEFEAKLRRQETYLITLITVAFLFGISYYIGRNLAISAMLASMFFGILVILASMRLKIGNPALIWLGTNAFSIYILQRIPMIIATEVGLNKMPLLFIIIVLPSTLLIASIFTTTTNRLDSIIFTSRWKIPKRI